MDTLLVTISRINRIRPDPNEMYEDEEVIQFYRQEFPLHFLQEKRPQFTREIIALCNDLYITKE
jgi:hypothetical protein